jgi:hypothetical protein
MNRRVMIDSILSSSVAANATKRDQLKLNSKRYDSINSSINLFYLFRIKKNHNIDNYSISNFQRVDKEGFHKNINHQKKFSNLT